MKQISFCITCRDRLSHLAETLPENLKFKSAAIEFVLVDFGSKDGLNDWVWERFSAEIREGTLRFFRVTNQVSWHMARAKNLSARLAIADYLFFLDADNFVAPQDIDFIAQASVTNYAVHQFSGNWDDGSCGRIGLPRTTFFDLGGYDESFLPMGGEDIDLLRRIQMVGLKTVKGGGPSKSALQHPTETRVKGVPDLHGLSAEDRWRAVNEFNLKYSTIRNALFGAKRDGGFASFSGELNGSKVFLDGLGNLRVGG